MVVGVLAFCVVVGMGAAALSLMAGMGLLMALLAYSAGGIAGLVLGLAAMAPASEPIASQKRAL